MIRHHARSILRHYPQVYLACHLRHHRTRANPQRLTDRDIVLLGHLDEKTPMFAGTLARHLGVGAPSLSAQLRRLQSLGFLTRTAQARDRRRGELRLTAPGAQAMAATSILDAGRVRALLVQLPPDERAAAVAGLAALARAARQLQHKYPNPSAQS